MKSMTGYGYGIYKCPEYSVEIEAKSYNNRYLDISHSINPLLSSYEEYVDSEIKKIAARGHVDVTLRLKIFKNSSVLSLDRELLGEYRKVFSEIAKETGEAPSFSDYASIENLIVSDRVGGQEEYREGVEASVRDCMEMLLVSKNRDGEGTRLDLERLGEAFENALAVIVDNADRLEDFFKETLLAKFNELMDTKADDPRVLQEVASLLVKYSINEEISRLKTHIMEYKRLIKSSEPVGKQLDFLCQEMNRECNTIASKSQLVDINLQVVKMKDNLENIREQIRNIE